MIELNIFHTIDFPWTHAPAIQVGDSRLTGAAPVIFVMVGDSDVPKLRVDVYGGLEPECCAFQEAILWHDVVVIGFGEYVHFVSLNDNSSRSLSLGSYFGNFYTNDETLLVASADHLFRVARDCSVVWKSDPVGIDGVLVSDFDREVISGRGEWDPPGGWLPFELDFATGKLLKNQTENENAL